MTQQTIALFGEAERGEYRCAYFCRGLDDLMDYFGHPPEGSRGLYCAVQALMYDSEVVFIRVKEEGFSDQDYFAGIHLLKNQQVIPNLAALYLPGVGDDRILGATMPLCEMYNTILIASEWDLYDYMTSRGREG